MMARVRYTCMLTMYAGLYSTFFTIQLKQKKSSHVVHKKYDQLAFFGLSKHEMYFTISYVDNGYEFRKKMTANFAPAVK